ncbi:MAG: hypothetical protein RLY93_20700 [Sumerlaeia bacterium]
MPERPKVTIENIGRLQKGVVGHEFNALIRDALRDCDDRPTNSGARKVGMEVILTPVADDAGGAGGVDLQVKLTSKRPPLESRKHFAKTICLSGPGGQETVEAFMPPDTADTPDMFEQTAE